MLSLTVHSVPANINRKDVILWLPSQSTDNNMLHCKMFVCMCVRVCVGGVLPTEKDVELYFMTFFLLFCLLIVSGQKAFSI